MGFMKFSSGEFMVVGPIPKDAEYKTVGDKQSSLTKFSVKASERADASGQKVASWTNCTAWHAAARACKDFKKGDVVLVTGKIEEREYVSNGETKKSKELVVDFVTKMTHIAPDLVPAPISTAQAGGSGDVDLSDFEELISDGDMPF